MPDFTRFGRSQREQVIGQAIGLPVTMTVFPLIAVLVTSATVVVYGEAIWSPVDLAGKITNPIISIFALFTLAVATLSVNVAANIVSPSYDFSNAWPSKISFRTGGLITGVIGILIQPWNLLASADLYIFTWLGFYSGATGAIAGVLIADYWLVRHTSFGLADLYKPSGLYRYARGWNWRAVVALAVGAFIALGGAYSALATDGSTTGPFPPDGIIALLKPVYDYGWVAALFVSGAVYWLLMKVVPGKEVARQLTEQPA
jgi:NCS1 family nucleobase:cation symporter-1